MALKHALNSIVKRIVMRPVCSQCGLKHFDEKEGTRTVKDSRGLLYQKTSLMQPVRYLTTTRVLLLKKTSADVGSIQDDTDLEDLLNEESAKGMVDEQYLLPGQGHRVFLIQPDLKRIPGFRYTLTSPEHQLEESITLVDSLPKWSVVYQSIERVKSLKSRELFGRGTLESLGKKIHSAENCTAVFLNIGMLSGPQLNRLQEVWRKPVYDRFTIVLQIFKVRARTKEARLQVALAEIPFYRSRLTGIHMGWLDQQKGGTSYIGGGGETIFELRHRMLKEKELKLKRTLSKIKDNRNILRKERVKREFPTVAVVGYTNAGKTSLIKSLTQDEEMQPRDQLFATLDVTVHAGLLPNRMKVLYIDTVGFISDIPTSLIASFAATLEDAVYADVIIHVRDVSHPDTEMQRHTVLQTLDALGDGHTDIHEKLIEVCNKVDKLDRVLHPDVIPEDAVGVSSTLGYGLEELVNRVESMTIRATGRVKKCLKIPMNGPHLAWLYKEATIEETRSCDDNPEVLLVYAVMTGPAYARFVTQFGSKERKKLLHCK